MTATQTTQEQIILAGARNLAARKHYGWHTGPVAPAFTAFRVNTAAGNTTPRTPRTNVLRAAIERLFAPTYY